MRGTAPDAGIGVYAKAVPLLLRNPAIAVIPLLMAVIAVLVGLMTSASGGGVIGGATSGLSGFIVLLLQLFGLGAACLMADDAWRHGKASFENGWSEARRRGGDLLMAALGVTLIFAVAQYAGALLGSVIPLYVLGFSVLALLLLVAAAVFLIWAIPAAAVGGSPGGAAIQLSIDRVRASPAAAIGAAVVSFLLLQLAVPYAATWLWTLLFPYIGGSIIVGLLIQALLQAIALAYIALIITKTYTDSAFTRRW
ncbi:MAG: hypothetical protein QOD51_2741 [Candidatus Eremiobacteraeota bacterium]|jgi:hypothetical protein|nr:hypothetical protein [Candidatus Eremiobacteraeota bacterium]